MKGTINRVALKDFMCYSFLEVHVGKHVNLLLAPNGCGKSSFVNGIILCLGGRPQDIGRGRALSSYVKAGCEQAQIHVELNNDEERPIVITRIIHLDNKSFWLINEEKVSPKDVETLTKKLHIQVDNLCQVLPQDRVSEFSCLNPHDLLECTQRSVGPCDLTQYHQELKSLSKEKNILVKRTTDSKEKIDKLGKQNHEMEATIKRMEKRLNILKQIKSLKKDHAWKLYQHHFTELKKLLQDKSQAQEVVKKLQAERQQKLNQVKKMRDKSDNCGKQVRQKVQRMWDADKMVNSLIEQVEREKKKIEQAREEYDSKLHTENGQEDMLAGLTLQLTKLESDLFKLSQNSDEETKQRIEGVTQNLKQQHDLLASANQDEHQVHCEINGFSQAIRAKEENLKKNENEAQVRLMQLSRSQPDLHKALMWLEQNRDKFKRHIYRPMMLELNLLNPSYATFVESTIPVRDLLAFVAEDADDMNAFLEEMRDKRKLRVNVICSNLELHPHSSTYQPSVPIEQLERYGFHMFVREMFVAPEPIMKYLCRSFKVHNIPVGTEKVDEAFMSIPVPTFFSQASKYNVRHSKYSGEKFTSVNSLSSANLLFMDNQEEAEELRRSINQLKEKREALQPKLAEVKQRITAIDLRIQEMRSMRRELEATGERKRVLESRIRTKRSQIEFAENSKVDILAEKRIYEEKFKRIMSRIVDAHQQMITHIQLSGDLCAEIHRLQLVEQEAHTAHVESQAASEDIVRRCAEQEGILSHLEKEISPLMQKADDLHKKALALTGAMPPPEFFSRGTLSEVTDMLRDLEVTAEFLDSEDSSVLNTFEQNKLQMQDLESNVKKLEKNVETICKKIENVQEKWLPPLEEVVETINKNYKNYFRKLGCCGEVLLSTPLDPSNYNEYGIVLNVKFRDSEPFTRLDGRTQSGGERSVATALYILALQQVTWMPFRIVDEINQGMDPVNERKVFEMLVNATQQEGAAQYFLLSPQLLPKLNYPDNMNIVTIAVVKDAEAPDLSFRNVYKCLAQKEKAESNKK